jgi:hypothetical protein
MLAVVLVFIFVKLVGWVRTVAGHHHEWLEFAAADRVLKWALVVAAVWIGVSLGTDLLANRQLRMSPWRSLDKQTQDETGEVVH